jgi:hypothetical protein
MAVRVLGDDDDEERKKGFILYERLAHEAMPSPEGTEKKKRMSFTSGIKNVKVSD